MTSVIVSQAQNADNAPNGTAHHHKKSSQISTEFDEKLMIDVDEAMTVEGGVNNLNVADLDDGRPSTPMLHEGEAKPALLAMTMDAENHYQTHQANIKKATEQIQQLRSSLETVFKKHTNSLYVKKAQTEDAFVYRFLVARQMHLNKASDMFRQAVEYREKHNLDAILNFPCPKASQFIRLGYQGWHGHDRFGRPIFLERTGSQSMKEVWKVGNLDERIAYHHFVTEYFIQRVCEDASRRSGRQIDQVVFIIDMKGFGTSHMVKVQYQYVNAIAKINSLILPEYLGAVFIVNAPRVFSMVWKIVRPWLDSRTREKIHIYSDAGKSAIEKLIDLEEVPEILGGKCNKCHNGNCLESPTVLAFHDMVAALNTNAKSTSSSSSTSSTKTSKSSTTGH